MYENCLKFVSVINIESKVLDSLSLVDIIDEFEKKIKKSTQFLKLYLKTMIIIKILIFN